MQMYSGKDYESTKRFALDEIENKDVPLNWRVEAMKLTKDKSAIIYNDFFTLSGIPPQVFDYKLGNVRGKLRVKSRRNNMAL